MNKNDFVTSIISTYVRNVLNDSCGSRRELVQHAYNTIVVRNSPCRLPQWHSPAQNPSCT